MITTSLTSHPDDETNSATKPSPATSDRVDFGNVSDQEIPGLIESDPYRALKYLKDRLTQSQIIACIGRSPRGAIQFVFDEAVRDQRLNYFVNMHSDILLELASHKLSADELDACARRSPACALDYPEPPLPPRTRAKCFARLFFQGDDDSLALMKPAEVAGSKLKFPGIWAEAFNEGNCFDFDNLIEAGDSAIMLEILRLKPSRKNLALFRDRESDLTKKVRREYLKTCGNAA